MYNKRITYLVACSLVLMTIINACKKTDNTSPASAITEKVKVSIRVGGDITISQTSMSGARVHQTGNYVFAKTVYDSTIYAVDVRMANNAPYAAGLFNKADNMMLEVPKGSDYTIRVAAIRKGTGPGLWWGIISGTTYNGHQYFEKPIKMALKNEMIYDTEYLEPNFLDTLNNLTVYSDINSFGEKYPYSQVDSYFGQTVYSAADSATTLSIPLKRISFGIRYNVLNLSGGRLIADYDNTIKTEFLTPEEISSSLRIYTVDRFRLADTLYSTNKLHLTLKWEKPDGSIQVLGDKLLSPVRNSLTTVNVTIPLKNTATVDIKLTDATWTGTDSVNF